MSYRSGIAQNVLLNPAPVSLYTFTTTATPTGQRNTIPINLPAGTFSMSLSYQATVAGTGGINLTNLNSGLSSSASGTVAIAPLPLSATASIFLANSQTIASSVGFSDFKSTVISLSAPTTIYLYNVIAWTVASGTPTINITQNLTVTELFG
jgi:uncharacterized membrane protein (DUF4010 family)